jgi:dihydroflavonol-4-reductase
MRAFVTGGTGFIGRRLVQQLLNAGYEVTVLARSEGSAADLRSAGARIVKGDICDRASLRAAMPGHEILFHLAAWYKIGSKDWQTAEAINVVGTRNVLGLAYELGIPKIIYTSTVAIFGDTHGKLPDESYRMPAQPFLTEYDRTKWKAHFEVALPLIEQGAPLIILMPGAVYGSGDPSLVGELMRFYYRGFLPALPGPEMTVTYAHVDDIANAHILAAEKGIPGESYILTGPVRSLKEIIKVWAKVSGKPLPWISIPARLITPLAPLARVLNSFLPLPILLSEEAAKIAGACYMGASDKARTELGWQTRPLEDGMRETFAWIAREADQKPFFSPRQKQAGKLLLLAGVCLILLWRLTRPHNPKQSGMVQGQPF